MAPVFHFHYSGCRVVLASPGRWYFRCNLPTADTIRRIPAVKIIIIRMTSVPYAEVTIRPAARGDDHILRGLVRSEHLNPMGLDWRNFRVAENSGGRIVGIGAVKTHGDGSREMASIATAPEWRDRGVAGAVIREILAGETGPLYLTCRDSMALFYERFGFRAIERSEMPPYFRRLHRLFTAATGIFRLKNRLLVMRRDGKT